jgi:hypothetical protein
MNHSLRMCSCHSYRWLKLNIMFPEPKHIHITCLNKFCILPWRWYVCFHWCMGSLRMMLGQWGSLCIVWQRFSVYIVCNKSHSWNCHMHSFVEWMCSCYMFFGYSKLGAVKQKLEAWWKVEQICTRNDMLGNQLYSPCQVANREGKYCHVWDCDYRWGLDWWIGFIDTLGVTYIESSASQSEQTTAAAMPIGSCAVSDSVLPTR